MSVICPTVLASSPGEFNRQMERIEEFVERTQLDFTDGDFTPAKSVAIEQAWWPVGVTADLHIMYRNPLEQLETIVSLNPHLVIVHAEAENIPEFYKEIENLGIERGIALLADSQPNVFADLIQQSDHVLIFSGDLGKFGGTANLGLLEKVKAIRAIKPSIEIGWDGGINSDNAKALIEGGIDVLNVGGYIQRAEEPRIAYETLKELL